MTAENKEALRKKWQEEEQRPFAGWDFSEFEGRWEEESVTWDYDALIRRYAKRDGMLLDMDTGGGERLLTLNHPHHLTAVTEGYDPNLALCREKLAPLGITVKAARADGKLDFADDTFQTVLNRHGDFDPREVFRVLRPGGGIFITQQVGCMNNRELSRKLIPGFQPPFPHHDLVHNVAALKRAGLRILMADECFPRLRFLDTGAVCRYAKIMEWECPGFTVDGCLDALLDIHDQIETKGGYSCTQHRFMIVAVKE